MGRLAAMSWLLLVVLVGVAPVSALAGTRSIWPDQCKPISANSIDDATARSMQQIAVIGAAGGLANEAIFQCEVKLPAGTRVTSLSVNASTNPDGFVSASLLRTRLGGELESVVYYFLNQGLAKDWYTTTDIDPAYATVTAGYRYWVMLNFLGDNAYAHGVRVSYR